MFVLDTNVVSEALKPLPNPQVIRWLDEQAANTLFLTSVSVAELMFGVGVLPEGRRKQLLSAAVNRAIDLFEDRVLAFDVASARAYGHLALKARIAGKGFPTPDGYIAAIAKSHDFAVASRDCTAFMAAGLKLIDPWTYKS